MTASSKRTAARDAGPELLVLQKWETFCGWFLEHTRRWPRSVRLTLTRRLENHALDLTELLVEARYERRLRPRLLREANLKLERMRFLCRIAVSLGVMPKRGFATAMRGVDEAGRMIHGWRVAIGARPARPTPPSSAP